MNILTKKALAEGIGTMVLVFVACGVAALTCSKYLVATASYMALKDGYLSALIITALAFGLVYIAISYSVGKISGCHINPAVSLGCLLTKRITLKEFIVYVTSQIIGGIVGAILIFGIFQVGHIDPLSDACNYAVAYWNIGISVGGIVAALIIEIALTAIFVYTFLNATDKNSAAGKKAGIVIGLTLTLVHLLGMKLTGTSVNPARSIATAFSSFIYFGNTTALAQVWMFIVAPLIGAVVAVIVYKALNTDKK